MKARFRRLPSRRATFAFRVSLLLIWTAPGPAGAAPPVALRLSKKSDAFFIEHDFVYQRFLQLARDGTYRQINRERMDAAEVDVGTWEQVPDGTVLLHFTRGGLRYRALLSGPLSMTLDDPRKFAALPSAAVTIRRWLAESQDVVFAAANLPEMAVAPLILTLDPEAESFRRDDLEALARQIDDFVWSEQHQTFRLTPSRLTGLPALLIQREAIFETGDLARVKSEYHVPRGQPPPFYFVQVDAGTFAKEAGSWQKLR